MSPCSGMTRDGYDDINTKTEASLFWMTAVLCSIATIGLMVVFGLYRKLTKPKFVKIIWAVITLGILNGITQLILRKY